MSLRFTGRCPYNELTRLWKELNFVAGIRVIDSLLIKSTAVIGDRLQHSRPYELYGSYDDTLLPNSTTNPKVFDEPDINSKMFEEDTLTSIHLCCLLSAGALSAKRQIWATLPIIAINQYVVELENPLTTHLLWSIPTGIGVHRYFQLNSYTRCIWYEINFAHGFREMTWQYKGCWEWGM